MKRVLMCLPNPFLSLSFSISLYLSLAFRYGEGKRVRERETVKEFGSLAFFVREESSFARHQTHTTTLCVCAQDERGNHMADRGVLRDYTIREEVAR